MNLTPPYLSSIFSYVGQDHALIRGRLGGGGHVRAHACIGVVLAVEDLLQRDAELVDLLRRHALADTHDAILLQLGAHGGACARLRTGSG